jgi:hypothetical protein
MKKMGYEFPQIKRGSKLRNDEEGVCERFI